MRPSCAHVYARIDVLDAGRCTDWGVVVGYGNTEIKDEVEVVYF